MEKLLDEGSILRAWFTSFTFSPAFAEHYLLPPLYADVNDLPKSMRQYEALSNQYLNGQTDIRFFYDANMLEEQSKRTVVPMHGVIIKDGFFHPKVILLQGEINSYLIVGSANIGINGWGRNREAVRVLKIATDVQAASIVDFWKYVASLSQDYFHSKSLNDLQQWVHRHRVHKREEDWYFIFNQHDNGKNRYQLLEGLGLRSGDDLYVWTPYFAKNSIAFIQKHFSDYYLHLAPDVKNGKMRTDVNTDEFAKHNTSIYIDKSFGEKEFMSHAKIWMAPYKIAIGSYNFTQNAFEANCEAAVIEVLSQHDHTNMTSVLISGANITAMDTDELNEEEKGPEHRYQYMVELTANWKKRLIGMRVDKTLPDCRLRLPGGVSVSLSGGKRVYEKIDLSPDERSRFFEALLSDRVFSLYTAKDNLYDGLIIEIEAQNSYRQPYGYTSIGEALSDWQHIDNKTTFNPSSLRYESSNDDVMEGQASDNDHFEEMSYFTLFAGFKKLNEEIETISRMRDWNFFVYGLPNIEAVKNLVTKYTAVNKPKLFHWFMVKELNASINLLNDHPAKPAGESKIETLPEPKIALSKKEKQFINSMKWGKKWGY